MMHVRIGTRGSDLALWQAREVAKKLAANGWQSTIVPVRTTGDRRTDVSLASIGGKGLFVKELEEALDRREIDIAVHSLKDVPSIIPSRFVLASFLERADARDVWISRDGSPIDALPECATIGTSAPRRRAQLSALYPHLIFETIRGNIDTRLRKVFDGTYDGIVLAAAGLERLGRIREITSWFGIDELLPAAGQGIVAIEMRADTVDVRKAMRSINHAETELRARCERGVLQHFDEQIDCYSAIAVHATVANGEITIRAAAGDLEGSHLIRVMRTGSDPSRVIRNVFDELIAKGAMDLVRATVNV